jgi:hypothetical protein
MLIGIICFSTIANLKALIFSKSISSHILYDKNKKRREYKINSDPWNYRAYTSLSPNLNVSICLAIPLLTVTWTTE